MEFFWIITAVMCLVIPTIATVYIRYIFVSDTLGDKDKSKSDLASTDASETDQLLQQRSRDNVDAYKRQVTALNRQLDLGEIEQQSYDALILESQQQLVIDAEACETDSLSNRKAGDVLSYALVAIASLLIPLLALLLYLPAGFSLGGSDHWQVKSALQRLDETKNSSDKNVELFKLAELIEEQLRSLRPDETLQNLLAQIYRGLGQYAKSSKLYRQLLEANAERADLRALLAESLYLEQMSFKVKGVANAESLAVEIDTLLKEALVANPNELMALSLSGMQAFQRNEWQQAIDFWRKALPMYPQNTTQAETLRNGVAAAERKLGIEPADNKVKRASADAVAQAAVRVRVSIDPALLTADDALSTPVFIFARPSSGSRMPLAARRLTLADLPVEAVLTDQDKMAAQSIAGRKRVIVGARLARSGQPIPQQGDVESEAVEVEVVDLTAVEKAGVESNDLPVTILHIQKVL